MIVVFGLVLGCCIAGYTILSSSGFGFAFPTINGELTIRPTFSRLVQFLLGRWIGLMVIALLIFGLGQIIESLMIQRFLLVISGFLGIFIIIYLMTGSSPEMGLAKISDLSNKRLPLPLLGAVTAGWMIAPTMVAMIWAFILLDTISNNIIFFTNIFLGYTIFHLPCLLNQQWARRNFYLYFIKGLLLAAGFIVIAYSIIVLT